MNLRLLSKILGLLLLMVGMAMGACFIYSWFSQGHWTASDSTRGLGISTAVTIIFSTLLVLAGRNTPTAISRKEGVAIVGLGWLLVATFGALPFLLCQPRLSPSNAIFESMSGFSTTGATVIGELGTIASPVLLWRALTQWLGGLGILVLFVALLSHLGIGNKTLFKHESSAQPIGNLQMRIGDLSARVWSIYLALTILCALGLYFLGMSAFDSLCHAFTAVSTGGFSNYDASLGYFKNPEIEVWIIIFMVLGGINFLLYVALTERRWSRLRQEEELRYYLLFLILASLAVFWSLQLVDADDTGWATQLRSATFQVVSIMTTTGYTTQDYNQWPHFTWVILLLLMGFGGSTGSTSGGIKISRWLVFFKLMWYQINSSFRPTIINTLKLNGGRLPQEQINQALFLICLSWVTIGFGSAVVSALQPNFDFISVFSAVITCLFNIGPGLEAVGPASNFAELKPATKYFLAFLMALGRLEFFAILVLFVPALWRRY